MKSKIAGPLKQDLNFDDWWESDPIPIPYFNNSAVKVVFTDAAFEEYMVAADQALQDLLKLTSIDREKDSHYVYKYYLQTLEFLDIEPLDLKSENNIWNFVRPIEIHINWPADKPVYLLVSCECKWEEEHGLQLVFKNGKLTRASGHDGHDED